MLRSFFLIILTSLISFVHFASLVLNDFKKKKSHLSYTHTHHHTQTHTTERERDREKQRERERCSRVSFLLSCGTLNYSCVCVRESLINCRQDILNLLSSFFTFAPEVKKTISLFLQDLAGAIKSGANVNTSICF